jgi:hypothetical protein
MTDYGSPFDWQVDGPLARAAWVMMLFLVAGCDSSLPETVSVGGRVTWQGEPVTQGTVAFMPVEPEEGPLRRAAVGRIQADGSYRLSTFGRFDGALPGQYRVAITDAEDFPFEAIETEPAEKAEKAAARGVLPATYALAHGSGLTAVVPADARKVEIDFDLPMSPGDEAP